MLKDKNRPTISSETEMKEIPGVKVRSLKDPDGGYSNPTIEEEDEPTTEKSEESKEQTPEKVSVFPSGSSQAGAVSYKPQNNELKILDPKIKSPASQQTQIGKRDNELPIYNIRVPQNKYIPPDDDGQRKCVCCSRLKNCWENLSERKKRTVKVSFMALIFLIGTAVGFIINSERGNWIFIQRNVTSICETKECVIAAGEMVSAMDPDVSPCDDFYKFACGGWIRDTAIPPTATKWSKLAELNERNVYNIKNLLEKEPEEMESVPFTEARKMYAACVNEETWEKAGVEPLLKILDDLGGLPMLKDDWSDQNFDWMEMLAIIRKKFRVSDIIEVDVRQDYKNNLVNSIYISQGHLFHLTYSIANNDHSTRNIVINNMMRTLRLLQQQMTTDQEPPKVPEESTLDPLSSDSTTNYTTSPNLTTTSMPDDTVTITTGNQTEMNTTSDTPDDLSTSNTTATSGTNSTSNSSASDETTTLPTKKDSEENPKTLLRLSSNSNPAENAKISKTSLNSNYADNPNALPFLDPYLTPLIKYGTKSELQNRHKSPSNASKNSAIKQLWEDVEDIWQFYVDIAKIMQFNPPGSSMEETYHRATIWDLTHLSNVDWLPFFKLLFESTSIDVDEYFNIIVQYPQFFVKLTEIMRNTPKRTLANAILYLVVNALENEVTPSRNMASTYSRYIGRRSYRPWFACADLVTHYLGNVATSLYINQDREAYLKDMEEVKNQIPYFYENMIGLMTGSKWMDNSTIAEAVKKINEMETLVGFSTRNSDIEMIKAIYKHFPTLSPDDHFSNFLKVQQYSSEVNFESLTKDPSSRKSWTVSELIANAFYDFEKNSIQIPIGFLQPFIYRRNTILPLLYGSVGFIIGHEIIHAFDEAGKFYAWNGTLHSWWSNASLTAYNTKSKCFEEEYTNFTIIEEIIDANGEPVKVDGVKTKSENIADNEGIALSWQVYQMIKNGKDQRLRGMEQYSADQLFFINFAQLWCANYNPKSFLWYLTHGAHTEEPVRVRAVVRNNIHFAQVFDCPSNSPMVTDTKCSLWT